MTVETKMFNVPVTFVNVSVLPDNISDVPNGTIVNINSLLMQKDIHSQDNGEGFTSYPVWVPVGGEHDTWFEWMSGNASITLQHGLGQDVIVLGIAGDGAFQLATFIDTYRGADGTWLSDVTFDVGFTGKVVVVNKPINAPALGKAVLIDRDVFSWNGSYPEDIDKVPYGGFAMKDGILHYNDGDSSMSRLIPLAGGLKVLETFLENTTDTFTITHTYPDDGIYVDVYEESADPIGTLPLPFTITGRDALAKTISFDLGNLITVGGKTVKVVIYSLGDSVAIDTSALLNVNDTIDLGAV